MRFDDALLGAVILVVVGTVVLALCTVARKWLELENYIRHERRSKP